MTVGFGRGGDTTTANVECRHSTINQGRGSSPTPSIPTTTSPSSVFTPNTTSPSSFVSHRDNTFASFYVVNAARMRLFTPFFDSSGFPLFDGIFIALMDGITPVWNNHT